MKRHRFFIIASSLLIVACSGGNNPAPTNKALQTTDQATPAARESTKLLVRFKAGADRTAIHEKLGAKVERQFSSVAGLELVVLPEGLSLQEALDYYNQHPGVRYAEAEQRYQAQ